MWQGNENAGAITRVLLAAAGATVGHSLEHLDGIGDLENTPKRDQ
jgi:hypothetical protein